MGILERFLLHLKDSSENLSRLEGNFHLEVG